MGATGWAGLWELATGLSGLYGWVRAVVSGSGPGWLVGAALGQHRVARANLVVVVRALWMVACVGGRPWPAMSGSRAHLVLLTWF